LAFDKITVKVFRYNPLQDVSPRYDVFKVPYAKGTKVLDSLIYIYENLDSSLAFRWSCKNVQCGSCAVLVNGKPFLACEKEPPENAVLEPLSGFPVVRDLVVDFEEFDERKRRIRPYPEMIAPVLRPIIRKQEEATRILGLSKCIECRICHPVCPSYEVSAEFAGPSLMCKLAALECDERDKGDRVTLSVLEGLYDCTLCHACSEACPKDIDLQYQVLERLRQLAVTKGVGPLPPQKELADKVAKTGWILSGHGKPLIAEIPETFGSSNERVGIFLGCMINLKMQDAGRALYNVLRQNSLEAITPHDQVCCGYPLLKTGQVEFAKNHLIKRNIEAFERHEIDTVITACACCGITLKTDYPRLSLEILGREPKFQVMDMSEFLTNEIKLNRKDMSQISMKVTLHDPCNLRRGQKIFEEPRKILTSIPGLKLLEMKDSDKCCGAGGGVMFGKQNIADVIGAKKVRSITETKTDAATTSCPFCIEQISQSAKNLGMEKFTVLHIADILSKAYSRR